MSSGFKQQWNLSAWALAHQQLVAFFMLVIVAAGVMSYERLPRNEDPAFTIKTAVVSASWPGATVQDTVSFVTDVLEKKLQETPYLDFIESYSRPGEAVIFVNLRDSTPPSEVQGIWYAIRKKMKDIAPSLPDGVGEPAVNDEFDDTFGTIYGFTADGYSPRELRDRVDDIRTELLATPDVGKIDVLGVQDEQIVAAFSPRQLAGMGLDLQQVTAALQAQNAVSPTGAIRTDNDKVALRVSGAFVSEESLRQVTLHIGGRFIPLTDIATVYRQAAEPPAPAFRVNGQPAIGLAVSMAPTGNMLDFGQALRSKMATIGASLPHGIEVINVADQSSVVKSSVNGFVKVLLEAVVIVLAVSFVSLGSRAGLVVAASIPMVLTMTFTGMEIAGIGLQRISLGALIIALGLLVDDAMITVEAMVSSLEKGEAREQAATRAYDTTAFPMLTGTLVMVAGFIPVGFAASSAGEYCYSLFIVVLISLLSSWAVAVLFSPLIGVWLLPKAMNAHDHHAGRLSRAYDRLLSTALRYRGRTLLLSVALLALAVVAAGRLEGEFFPASDRPELLVSLTLPRNASQQATEREVVRLEQSLTNDPDLDHFSTYVGSGAVRFYLPMDVLLQNENIAQLVVVAKGLKERDALRARLEKRLQQDFSHLVTRVSPLELGPPVGWPLKYRVTGPDIDKVREYAAGLATLIGGNPDAREVNLTAGEPERAIRIDLNQTEARAVGISSQDVASALATIFSGSVVTSVRDRNRMVGVVVRARDEERQNLDTVASLQLRAANGQRVPLGQIASVGYGVDEPIIWRRQRLPFITVQTDLAPGVRAQTLSTTLAPQVAAYQAALPAGYHIEEGGSAAESNKGNNSVYQVLPVTLLVMLILLMVQLQRFSRMMLALLMAPFGLIGVVAAMLPTGTPMGFVALLGVIALAGMIIRNAVILISEVDTNTAAGMTTNEAIIHAARHRSRPILLTALAAILGMIPIATQVFWGPMAYAIIGGLIVATLLTLTVLPAAVSLVMQWETRVKMQR
ncbi:efflux RND transporter permease subunit [Dickeya dianthicola]|uniref:efflux RND transporter permease subunit n=1 Tax=Dickeya dianthicola TaxID=204039 RepID=UPI0003A804B0|nr:efflux RND transporter permease subunit [Dickeya dianthicola]ATO31857.1 RND efflux transporter [Dickeya dianthicola RNS04.9]MBT1431047.1 efflux RND transporter permease subunit [Dickeya dianthicola]MCA7003861.1 efflux RND transporter permease subunit [Dickeya dianthicola]MCI4068111.1 efflux RND transporter permease subunit [Dickeya dianthicola]MCI4155148.1 efflux RND transporter permease subunit [Dickeya dianthicola]